MLKVNFSVTFSVSNRSISSSRPAVLPQEIYWQAKTGTDETVFMWLFCDGEDSQRKGEVGDIKASNKHTAMERWKVAAVIILKVNKHETESNCHLRVLPDGQIISHRWKKKKSPSRTHLKLQLTDQPFFNQIAVLRMRRTFFMTTQHGDSRTSFDCDASKWGNRHMRPVGVFLSVFQWMSHPPTCEIPSFWLFKLFTPLHCRGASRCGTYSVKIKNICCIGSVNELLMMPNGSEGKLCESRITTE